MVLQCLRRAAVLTLRLHATTQSGSSASPRAYPSASPSLSPNPAPEQVARRKQNARFLSDPRLATLTHGLSAEHCVAAGTRPTPPQPLGG